MDTFQNPSPTQMQAPKEGIGGMATIIVVAIVVLAGAYFYMMSAQQSVIKEAAVVDTSNKALENELGATGEIDIESDLSGIDKEFAQ